MTTASAPNVLEVCQLGMEFPNGNGGLPVLDGISFSVRPQEFVCIVGPSGCGKTTLLRLLDGLLMPTRGEIRFEGEPLQHPRRRVGFVFQQANLMPWRTVEANISLPLELVGSPEAERRTRAHELISLVGLVGFEAALPADLSGGMAQRVAIARALAPEPDMLLLDEPFGSLDALTRERMTLELLRIWAASEITVVCVTHSIAEAVLMADRVLVLGKRPARLMLDLAISLPRPRTLALAHTSAFGELAGEVRAAIESA
jgi:NitT/TauT family transport system ATP-binding protein